MPTDRNRRKVWIWECKKQGQGNNALSYKMTVFNCGCAVLSVVQGVLNLSAPIEAL